MPAGAVFLKNDYIQNASIVLMWYMLAGSFFLKKRKFSETQALCLCGICPKGLFFPRKVFFLKKCRHDDDDSETPDPVQAQIPSHAGIKYPVSGIPPSDLVN